MANLHEINAIPSQLFTSDWPDIQYQMLNVPNVVINSVTVKKDCVLIDISQHVMDEMGGWDGYENYTVKIPVLSIYAVTGCTTITGKRGNRAKYNFWKDEFHEMFIESLENWCRSHWVNFRTGEINQA